MKNVIAKKTQSKLQKLIASFDVKTSDAITAMLGSPDNIKSTIATLEDVEKEVVRLYAGLKTVVTANGDSFKSLTRDDHLAELISDLAVIATRIDLAKSSVVAEEEDEEYLEDEEDPVTTSDILDEIGVEGEPVAPVYTHASPYRQFAGHSRPYSRDSPGQPFILTPYHRLIDYGVRPAVLGLACGIISYHAPVALSVPPYRVNPASQVIELVGVQPRNRLLQSPLKYMPVDGTADDPGAQGVLVPVVLPQPPRRFIWKVVVLPALPIIGDIVAGAGYALREVAVQEEIISRRRWRPTRRWWWSGPMSGKGLIPDITEGP